MRVTKAMKMIKVTVYRLKIDFHVLAKQRLTAALIRHKITESNMVDYTASIYADYWETIRQ